jgi:hypothetical protein
MQGLDGDASAISKPQGCPGAEDDHAQSDASRQNHDHRAGSALRRTSPHEPRLIGETANGEQRKHRLQSLQEQQTARAGE